MAALEETMAVSKEMSAALERTMLAFLSKAEEDRQTFFCEPSLEDPLGERFVQFCEQAVVENQVDERKEEQTEDLEEPHQEKEKSTKSFSTLALISETPRG